MTDLGRSVSWLRSAMPLVRFRVHVFRSPSEFQAKMGAVDVFGHTCIRVVMSMSIFFTTPTHAFRELLFRWSLPGKAAECIILSRPE